MFSVRKEIAAFILLGVEVWLFVHIHKCIKQGFVPLRYERVARNTHPIKYAIILVCYIAFLLPLTLFTIWLLWVGPIE